MDNNNKPNPYFNSPRVPPKVKQKIRKGVSDVLKEDSEEKSSGKPSHNVPGPFSMPNRIDIPSVFRSEINKNYTVPDIGETILGVVKEMRDNPPDLSTYEKFVEFLENYSGGPEYATIMATPVEVTVDPEHDPTNIVAEVIGTNNFRKAKDRFFETLVGRVMLHNVSRSDIITVCKNPKVQHVTLVNDEPEDGGTVRPYMDDKLYRDNFYGYVTKQSKAKFDCIYVGYTFSHLCQNQFELEHMYDVYTSYLHEHGAIYFLTPSTTLDQPSSPSHVLIKNARYKEFAQVITRMATGDAFIDYEILIPDHEDAAHKCDYVIETISASELNLKVDNRVPANIMRVIPARHPEIEKISIDDSRHLDFGIVGNPTAILERGSMTHETSINLERPVTSRDLHHMNKDQLVIAERSKDEVVNLFGVEDKIFMHRTSGDVFQLCSEGYHWGLEPGRYYKCTFTREALPDSPYIRVRLKFLDTNVSGGILTRQRRALDEYDPIRHNILPALQYIRFTYVRQLKDPSDDFYITDARYPIEVKDDTFGMKSSSLFYYTPNPTFIARSEDIDLQLSDNYLENASFLAELALQKLKGLEFLVEVDCNGCIVNIHRGRKPTSMRVASNVPSASIQEVHGAITYYQRSNYLGSGLQGDTIFKVELKSIFKGKGECNVCNVMRDADSSDALVASYPWPIVHSGMGDKDLVKLYRYREQRFLSLPDDSVIMTKIVNAALRLHIFESQRRNKREKDPTSVSEVERMWKQRLTVGHHQLLPEPPDLEIIDIASTVTPEGNYAIDNQLEGYWNVDNE